MEDQYFDSIYLTKAISNIYTNFATNVNANDYSNQKSKYIALNLLLSLKRNVDFNDECYFISI